MVHILLISSGEVFLVKHSGFRSLLSQSDLKGEITVGGVDLLLSVDAINSLRDVQEVRILEQTLRHSLKICS